MMSAANQSLSLMDARERACYTYLPNFTIANLPEGDYIAGGCIIERKTWEDYHASILDGRVVNFYKLVRYRDNNPGTRAILILEGDLSKLHSLQMLRVQENMANYLPQFALEIVKTANLEETMKYIESLAGQPATRQSWMEYFWPQPKTIYNTMTDQDISIKKILFLLDSRPNCNLANHREQMIVLCGIPGISEHMASELLKHFNLNQLADPANREAIINTQITSLRDNSKSKKVGTNRYLQITTYLTLLQLTRFARTLSHCDA
jgi:ERCC4-type nuclease